MSKESCYKGDHTYTPGAYTYIERVADQKFALTVNQREHDIAKATAEKHGYCINQPIYITGLPQVGKLELAKQVENAFSGNSQSTVNIDISLDSPNSAEQQIREVITSVADRDQFKLSRILKSEPSTHRDKINEAIKGSGCSDSLYLLFLLVVILSFIFYLSVPIEVAIPLGTALAIIIRIITDINSSFGYSIKDILENKKNILTQKRRRRKIKKTFQKINLEDNEKTLEWLANPNEDTHKAIPSPEKAAILIDELSLFHEKKSKVFIIIKITSKNIIDKLNSNSCNEKYERNINYLSHFSHQLHKKDSKFQVVFIATRQSIINAFKDIDSGQGSELTPLSRRLIDIDLFNYRESILLLAHHLNQLKIRIKTKESKGLLDRLCEEFYEALDCYNSSMIAQCNDLNSEHYKSNIPEIINDLNAFEDNTIFRAYSPSISEITQSESRKIIQYANIFKSIISGATVDKFSGYTSGEIKHRLDFFNQIPADSDSKPDTIYQPLIELFQKRNIPENNYLDHVLKVSDHTDKLKQLKTFNALTSIWVKHACVDERKVDSIIRLLGQGANQKTELARKAQNTLTLFSLLEPEDRIILKRPGALDKFEELKSNEQAHFISLEKLQEQIDDSKIKINLLEKNNTSESIIGSCNIHRRIYESDSRDWSVIHKVLRARYTELVNKFTEPQQYAPMALFKKIYFIEEALLSNEENENDFDPLFLAPTTFKLAKMLQNRLHSNQEELNIFSSLFLAELTKKYIPASNKKINNKHLCSFLLKGYEGDKNTKNSEVNAMVEVVNKFILLQSDKLMLQKSFPSYFNRIYNPDEQSGLTQIQKNFQTIGRAATFVVIKLEKTVKSIVNRFNSKKNGNEEILSEEEHNRQLLLLDSLSLPYITELKNSFFNRFEDREMFITVYEKVIYKLIRKPDEVKELIKITESSYISIEVFSTLISLIRKSTNAYFSRKVDNKNDLKYTDTTTQISEAYHAATDVLELFYEIIKNKNTPDLFKYAVISQAILMIEHTKNKITSDIDLTIIEKPKRKKNYLDLESSAGLVIFYVKITNKPEVLNSNIRIEFEEKYKSRFNQFQNPDFIDLVFPKICFFELLQQWFSENIEYKQYVLENTKIDIDKKISIVLLENHFNTLPASIKVDISNIFSCYIGHICSRQDLSKKHLNGYLSTIIFDLLSIFVRNKSMTLLETHEIRTFAFILSIGDQGFNEQQKKSIRKLWCHSFLLLFYDLNHKRTMAEKVMSEVDDLNDEFINSASDVIEYFCSQPLRNEDDITSAILDLTHACGAHVNKNGIKIGNYFVAELSEVKLAEEVVTISAGFDATGVKKPFAIEEPLLPTDLFQTFSLASCKEQSAESILNEMKNETMDFERRILKTIQKRSDNEKLFVARMATENNKYAYASARGPLYISYLMQLFMPFTRDWESASPSLKRNNKSTQKLSYNWGGDLWLGASNSMAVVRVSKMHQSIYLANSGVWPRVIQQLLKLRRVMIFPNFEHKEDMVKHFINNMYESLKFSYDCDAREVSVHEISDGKIDARKLRTFESMFKKVFSSISLNIDQLQYEHPIKSKLHKINLDREEQGLSTFTTEQIDQLTQLEDNEKINHVARNVLNLEPELIQIIKDLINEMEANAVLRKLQECKL